MSKDRGLGITETIEQNINTQYTQEKFEEQILKILKNKNEYENITLSSDEIEKMKYILSTKEYIVMLEELYKENKKNISNKHYEPEEIILKIIEEDLEKNEKYKLFIEKLIGNNEKGKISKVTKNLFKHLVIDDYQKIILKKNFKKISEKIELENLALLSNETNISLLDLALLSNNKKEKEEEIIKEIERIKNIIYSFEILKIIEKEGIKSKYELKDYFDKTINKYTKKEKIELEKKYEEYKKGNIKNIKNSEDIIIDNKKIEKTKEIKKYLFLLEINEANTNLSENNISYILKKENIKNIMEEDTLEILEEKITNSYIFDKKDIEKLSYKKKIDKLILEFKENYIKQYFSISTNVEDGLEKFEETFKKLKNEKLEEIENENIRGAIKNLELDEYIYIFLSNNYDEIKLKELKLFKKFNNEEIIFIYKKLSEIKKELIEKNEEININKFLNSKKEFLNKEGINLNGISEIEQQYLELYFSEKNKERTKKQDIKILKNEKILESNIDELLIEIYEYLNFLNKEQAEKYALLPLHKLLEKIEEEELFKDLKEKLEYSNQMQLLKEIKQTEEAKYKKNIKERTTDKNYLKDHELFFDNWVNRDIFYKNYKNTFSTKEEELTEKEKKIMSYVSYEILRFFTKGNFDLKQIQEQNKEKFIVEMLEKGDETLKKYLKKLGYTEEYPKKLEEIKEKKDKLKRLKNKKEQLEELESKQNELSKVLIKIENLEKELINIEENKKENSYLMDKILDKFNKIKPYEEFLKENFKISSINSFIMYKKDKYGNTLKIKEKPYHEYLLKKEEEINNLFDIEKEEKINEKDSEIQRITYQKELLNNISKKIFKKDKKLIIKENIKQINIHNILLNKKEKINLNNFLKLDEKGLIKVNENIVDFYKYKEEIGKYLNKIKLSQLKIKKILEILEKIYKKEQIEENELELLKKYIPINKKNRTYELYYSQEIQLIEKKVNNKGKEDYYIKNTNIKLSSKEKKYIIEKDFSLESINDILNHRLLTKKYFKEIEKIKKINPEISDFNSYKEYLRKKGWKEYQDVLSDIEKHNYLSIKLTNKKIENIINEQKKGKIESFLSEYNELEKEEKEKTENKTLHTTTENKKMKEFFEKNLKNKIFEEEFLKFLLNKKKVINIKIRTIDISKKEQIEKEKYTKNNQQELLSYLINKALINNNRSIEGFNFILYLKTILPQILENDDLKDLTFKEIKTKLYGKGFFQNYIKEKKGDIKKETEKFEKFLQDTTSKINNSSTDTIKKQNTDSVNKKENKQSQEKVNETDILNKENDFKNKLEIFLKEKGITIEEIYNYLLNEINNKSLPYKKEEKNKELIIYEEKNYEELLKKLMETYNVTIEELEKLIKEKVKNKENNIGKIRKK